MAQSSSLLLDNDFEANPWNARASSKGQERQFDSQSAVKQAVSLAKRSPLQNYEYYFLCFG